MFSNLLLTLDENTLFYFSHVCNNDTVPLMSNIISNWRTEVKQVVPKVSLGWPLGSRSITTSRLAQSKTFATSVKNMTTELTSVQMGAISDEDKTQGPECNFAVNSPPKGKKQLTSKVCFNLFYFISFSVLMYI